MNKVMTPSFGRGAATAFRGAAGWVPSWGVRWVALESCDGEIWVPLAGLPGWGLVCGALRVGGGSMAGGGFALHGFSSYLNVA